MTELMFVFVEYIKVAEKKRWDVTEKNCQKESHLIHGLRCPNSPKSEHASKAKVH